MNEAQSRKPLLKEFDRLGPIHQAGVLGQPECRVKSPDQVKPEGVERADPHGRSGVLALECDPLGHLSGRLVREGQEENPTGVDVVGEQPFDSGRQRLSLAGPGTGLEQIGSPPMPSRGGLQRVERALSHLLLWYRLDRREQKRIEHLLTDDLKGCAEPIRDSRPGEAAFEVKLADHGTRKQKLARE